LGRLGFQAAPFLFTPWLLLAAKEENRFALFQIPLPAAFS
jgi:hypothetical protein